MEEIDTRPTNQEVNVETGTREATSPSVADALIEGWAFRSSTNRNMPRILAARSPGERALQWGQVSAERPLLRDVLRQALKVDAESTNLQGTIIALSHDHYLSIAGGLQNCVRDQQSAFLKAGWNYLHICPNRPLPLLADAAGHETFEVVASLNGETLGVALLSDIEAIAGELANKGSRVRCIVHHMLGFAPESVARLTRACADKEPTVWLHDLFTLCPSIHLLRNESNFCFAPPENSAVCQICNAGSDRTAHVHRVRAFFESVCPKIVTPSRTLLNFWKNHGKYAYSDSDVTPLCELVFDGRSRALDLSRPLRIGFLGSPYYHKGWHTFEALVRWHLRDQRYAFYHLGSIAPDVPNLQHIPVTVTREDRWAMVDAVKAAELDVVINWSMCYESFSFVTMEAIAGGAFVITRRDAGNVWPMIRAVSPNRGCALSTETELFALFASGDILPRVTAADRRTGSLRVGAYAQPMHEDAADA